MLFTDTADMLAKMARETLVQARLPSFQIPAAIEVLTLGTYSRLPTCVRERIVPPDPITPAEKKATLLRLNQIIQQRLVTCTLPAKMRNLRIENGRVTFHVINEFELSLTLMGDASHIPWRVLGLEILVCDRDSSVRDLVLPQQVHYIKELIQSRLLDNTRPLVDAYNVLHSFCLSLQMEVLKAQCFRLCGRLKDFLTIEDYQVGKRLVVSYWKETNSSGRVIGQGMKLCIEIDPSSESGLQITHSPELGGDITRVINETLNSEHLSFERLFIHTTHERSKSLLVKLQKDLSEIINVESSTVTGCPPILDICVLEPCSTPEKLLISVDALTGLFMAHIPQFEDCPLMSKFQGTVREPTRIISWLKELRVWIVKQRCRKTVESLAVQVHESLPLATNSDPGVTCDESTLFFHFSRHRDYYLMVQLRTQDLPPNVTFVYSLLSIEHVTFDGRNLQEPNTSIFEAGLQKSFIRVISVAELDMNSLSGKESSIKSADSGKKRKNEDDTQSGIKRVKHPASFFISELAFLISFCEEKLSYGTLSNELQRRGISHQVRVGSEPSYSHMIELVQFPPKKLYPSSRLQKDLLNCTIRLQGKGNKIWTVSLSFFNCPVTTLSPKENATRKTVNLMYDFATGSRAHVIQMVDELLEDWSAIERLYNVVCDFGRVAENMKSLIDIRSFTYKKLFLSYGPGKSFSVAIHWKSLEKRFQLNFGVTGTEATNSNPHVLVAAQITHEFNQHRSIATLVETLSTTFEPLLSILKLSSIAAPGLSPSKPGLPIQTFTVIPQTSTHVKLVYRAVYCLDITIQPDGLISIRDGAYTVFDKIKTDDLIAITGLKSFLNKYVDKNAAQLRRPSQAEDENPPSPSHSESVDQYLYSAGQVKSASPSSQDASRSVPHTLPSSLGSNPNTPSSPHTSLLSHVGYGASPGFPVASPHSIPSHTNMPAPSPSLPQGSLPDHSPAMFSVNSPAASAPMHAPSPGSFMPTASPGPSTHMQSPATNYMPSHDHPVNSPFHTASNVNIHSPAAAGWAAAGSPSIPRPSPRPMTSAQSPGSSSQPPPGQSPQTPNSMHSSAMTPASSSATRPTNPIVSRSWAAAMTPTVMTAAGFQTMCTPAPLEATSPGVFPHYNSLSQTLSPLDRFLGCVYLRGHASFTLRKAANENDITIIPSNEPGTSIQFKTSTHDLQFKISIDPLSMQSLHMNIFPASDQNKHQWTQDDLQALERFFEVKVR